MTTPLPGASITAPRTPPEQQLAALLASLAARYGGSLKERSRGHVLLETRQYVAPDGRPVVLTRRAPDGAWSVSS